MAKQSLNITDFSGGINSLDNKRDLEENQVVELDSLISYSSGDIKLAGGFINSGAIHNIDGGFIDEVTQFGRNSLSYLNPSVGFKATNKATVAVSSDTGTFTVSSGSHGLTNGTKIVILLSISPTFVGKKLVITNTGTNTFTATGCTGLTDASSVHYSIESNFDSSQFNYMTATQEENRLHYFLKFANEGKFGFFNLLAGTFYGSLDTTENYYGGNSWFFDTRYLWDWQQTNISSNGLDSDTSTLSPIENTPVHDTFYIDGVYRVSMEANPNWLFGHCRRPVGLYYIDKKTRFTQTAGHTNIIEPGWYPLRTHCLGLDEYKSDQNHNELGFHNSDNSSSDTGLSPGVMSYVVGGSTTAAAFAQDADFTTITNPYTFNIGLGHGNSASGTGDWMFDTTSDSHSKLGVGVSLLYDNINYYEGSPQQESSITKIFDVNGSPYITMTGDSNNDRAQLYLYWSMYVGNSSISSGASEFLAPTGSNDRCIPELRGSGVNQGYGQMSHWNPRIVGANIWLTYDSNGPIDDPLYLATINFSNDYSKDGRSKSHDGLEATDWTTNASHGNNVHQIITGMVGIPSTEYSLYHEKMTAYEQRHSWYKTSAIVNRRLYAGNVSYFKDTDTSSMPETYKISKFPDRILRSPVNQFDTLSSSSFLDVSKNDGENIIKLVAFKDQLLIFKNNTFYVVDTSGDLETIIATYKGYGVEASSHVHNSRDYVFWINRQGIYSYDGEKAIDLIKDRLSQDTWKKNMFNIASHPVYDPQQDLLMVFCKNTNESDDANSEYADKLLVIDAATGSVFYKSKPAYFSGNHFSNGVYANSLLYITSILGGDVGTDSFSTTNTTIHINEVLASAEFSFTLAASGTHDDGNACNNNNPNVSNDFLTIRKGGTWTNMNASALITANLTNNQGASRDTKDQIIHRCNVHTDDGEGITGVQDSYDISCSFNFVDDHGSDALFTVKATALEAGSAYNIIAEDVESSEGYSNDTGIGFRSTSSGDPQTGNIRNGYFFNNISYVAQAQGVWKIEVDRNGNTTPGVGYVLLFMIYQPDITGLVLFSRYMTGNTDEYIGTYVNELDTSVSVAVRNDRLLSNLKEYYENNNLFVAPNNTEGSYKLTDFFTIGSVTGTSGSKYFNLTARTDMPEQASNFETIDFESFTTGPASSSSGNLLVWTNSLPLDSNGNPTIYSHDRIVLETRDIDFGEPNVRKKVYKAYITYKGGDGHIKIQYQANQSGTWSTATVTDATTAGYLNDSSNQTRQEITFGTGGNNVYSFALRLSNKNPVFDFEINDLSFIFRIKKPK